MNEARGSFDDDIAALLHDLEGLPAVRPGHAGTRGYLVAFVAFVVLGLSFGSMVVNWIVGPLFPALVLGAGPAVAARLRRVLGGRAAS